MSMLPGAGPQRRTRSSQLMLHWRSADRSLDALSGQKGTFRVIVPSGAVPSGAADRNDYYLIHGIGQPRWDQHSLRGNVLRLAMEGEVAGQVNEYLTWDNWVSPIQAVSIYWKVWPMYAPGEVVAGGVPWFGPMVGVNHIQSGGYFAIRRNGANWEAQRNRNATIITSTVAEPNTTVFPLELLAVFSNPGTVQIFGRDAVGALFNGGIVTNAALMTAEEIWGGSAIALGGIQDVTDAQGGRYFHERLKIARGAKTFAQFDLLS